MLIGARWMQTVCLSGRHSHGLLVSSMCHHLPLCSAPEPSGTSDQSSRLAAVRLRCGADANCLPVLLPLARAALPTESATTTFLFALHRSRQGPLINRAGLRLLFGARRMQTVCLSGQRSHELLADKRCHHLPLCSAPEPSGTSDQSSRLVAALRCEADANCFMPILLPLARAALPTESATTFLFALHPGAVRDL